MTQRDIESGRPTEEEALRAFHDFFRDNCEGLFFHFGQQAVDLYNRASAARGAGKGELSWPKERDVGRVGDMHPSAHLRVGLDADNDVYVSVWDNDGGGSVEFCCPGAGGGKSARTREALITLMVAIETDNAEFPRKDWWALRRAPAGE